MNKRLGCVFIATDSQTEPFPPVTFTKGVSTSSSFPHSTLIKSYFAVKRTNPSTCPESDCFTLSLEPKPQKWPFSGGKSPRNKQQQQQQTWSLVKFISCCKGVTLGQQQERNEQELLTHQKRNGNAMSARVRLANTSSNRLLISIPFGKRRSWMYSS